MPLPYSHGCYRNQSRLASHWKEVQPTQGSYVGNNTNGDRANMVLAFTDVMAMCAEANAVGRDVCYSIWRTPNWASDAADQINGSATVMGPYGVGDSNAPRNSQYVYDFTLRLLQVTNATYRGIRYIEYGNEPEFWANAAALNAYIAGSGRPFWTGTALQNVKDGAQMRRAVNDFNNATPVSRQVIALSTSHWDTQLWIQQCQTVDPVTGMSGHDVGHWSNIHIYSAFPNKAYGCDMESGCNSIAPARARSLMTGLGLPAKPVAITEWGVAPDEFATMAVRFNAQSLAIQVRELKRYIAAVAMSNVPLFIISNFSNLVGTTTPATPQTGWTNASDPGPTAIREFYNAYLQGKTILPFPESGWFADGSMRLRFSDGSSWIG